MAENNGEEHVMSEEEFQELYQRGLDFYAEVKNRGGMWVVEEWCFALNREMKKRGMPIFTLDDERVDCRVREIKAEKAKKREEDPEGYKQAQKRYIDLLKKQLEESFSQELGSADNLNNTGEIEEDQEDILLDKIEQLDSAETELYQFESERRNWRDELAKLKIQVGDKKQGIIENLPDDQEFHMSDIYRNAGNKSSKKIADLEGEMKGLPMIKMRDILKRAIEDVELTMDEYRDAQGLENGKETKETGVSK